MGKRMSPLFSAVLDRILFILAGNDNIHKSLDEFEIQPDSTTGFHGYRYGLMGKMVSPLFPGCFLSVPFLNLQAMMTCMRARKSSNFGLIEPPTAELN